MNKLRIFLKNRTINLLTDFIIKTPSQNGFGLIFRVSYDVENITEGIQAIEVEDAFTGKSSFYLLKNGYLKFNEVILSGQIGDPIMYEYEIICITDWRYKDDVQSESAS